MVKKFKNGLYVGKFVAYHKGHQNCINHFSSLCENLKVVLCTKPSDRVPGNIRKTWLEQDLKYNINKEIIDSKKIELFHLVEDDIPLYPIGLNQWCTAIKDLVGSFEVMFGNEDYVEECSKIFKTEYYIPDMSRAKFHISSTKILDSKLKYYDMLNTVSKAYFNKKVLITGAEHTGKTTLIKNLAKHYKTDYIEEYGVGFFENEILKAGLHGLSNWKEKDYINLIIHHNNLVNEAIKKPNKILFVDTDALLSEVYCNLYIRNSSDSMNKLIKNQKFDLTCLLTNEGTYLDSSKNEYFKKAQVNNHELISRDFLFQYLKFSLNYFKIPFTEFSNNLGYEKRMENVINEINTAFMI